METPALVPSELTCDVHNVQFMGTSTADCPLCQRAAPTENSAEKSSPDPASLNVVTQASAEPSPAPPAPQPAPAAAPHAKLADTLKVIATVIGDAATFLGPGPWSMLLGLASSGINFVSSAVQSAGSANALSEAQAEQLATKLTSGLADLTSPLPTPAQIEAQQ